MVRTMVPRTQPKPAGLNGRLQHRTALHSSIQSVPRRTNFGVTLAATEGLPEAFVDQPITLTALRAGQQKAAAIGFNGGHS
jgi:hypothetical protein